MKPSERIKQIWNTANYASTIHGQFQCILDYLDEAEERNSWGPSPAIEIVPLLQEIERQKFNEINRATRWEQERLKNIFDKYVGNATGFDLLRDALFGEETKKTK